MQEIIMKDNHLPSIKYWSKDDRPREKLADKGKTALSDAELLAILIRLGNKDESAVSLSKRILASVDGNLNRLAKLSETQLKKFKGIGLVKAITIIACLELGKRRQVETKVRLKKVTSSKMVFDIMQPIIGELPHEEFWIIYLNNSNKVLKKLRLSKGGITGTLVDIRLVLKTALEVGAVAIILAHNHPSGTLKASAADKAITKKLSLGAENIDIKVLDHLIITEKEYFSFADENLL